VFFQYRT